MSQPAPTFKSITFNEYQPPAPGFFPAAPSVVSDAEARQAISTLIGYMNGVEARMPSGSESPPNAAADLASFKAMLDGEARMMHFYQTEFSTIG